MRILLATAVAALALAVPGAADVATSPPSIPQFTGWISGANVILHWVPAAGAAQYQLLRDGTVMKTLSAGTHEWLMPVTAARGHGFQVQALDASGTAGPATYERLSPLPALRGKTLAAANAALKAAGFKPGTILSYRTYGPKGIVIDVRTRGVVPLGWEVGLMVSK
jgi:hypothetical protein